MSNYPRKDVRAPNQPKNEMLVFGKMAPQVPELEAAIIGCMMLEAQCIPDILEIIQNPEVFYTEPNQKIFGSIRKMFENGTRVDFMTVTEFLKKNNELDAVGGAYYITSLTRDIVSSAHIEEYARIVIEKYLLREVIRISGELINEAYDDSNDVFQLIHKAEASYSKLSEDNVKTDYRHISHNAVQDIDDIEEHRKKVEEQGATLTGVPTGFPTVNRITNGWQNTDLIILAARPSVGKTAFALNLALNAGVPVGFFSLEMNTSSLRRRIISMQTKVGLTNITSCQLTGSEFDRIRQNVSQLRNTNLYVDDSDTITVFDIKNKVRRMKKREGVGLIIIDYLQLITATNERMMREQQVSQISRELKKLAKEVDIPIIALSQLNRSIDTRKEIKEPMLSDLRESGAIEQDADLVSFLYWHDSLIRWKLAKHRNGKCDRVDFIPNLDIQLFKEVGQDFPDKEVTGFSPTPHSGKLIPMAEAMQNQGGTPDPEEDFPF